MNQSFGLAGVIFSCVLPGAVAIAGSSVALNTYGDATTTVTTATTNTTPTACLFTGKQTKNPDTAEIQKATLSAISEQVQVGDTITGHFEQRKFIAVLPQPLLSKGYFLLDLNSQLEWSITEPLPSRMTFDDKGIRQSQNGQQIWQISNDRPSVAIIGQLIRAALSFNWPTIKTHFSIDVCSNQHSKNKQWTLILIPKDKVLQTAVSRIDLKGERHLEALTLFEANNDRTEITFKIP